MQTKIYVSLFLTVLLGFVTMSCEKEEVPENLVGIQTMSDILFDFHLAGAFVDEQNQFAYKERLVMRHEFVDGILLQKGLDRETFYESYVYYLEHPVVMDTIYTRVFTRVGALQQEYGRR